MRLELIELSESPRRAASTTASGGANIPSTANTGAVERPVTPAMTYESYVFSRHNSLSQMRSFPIHESVFGLPYALFLNVYGEILSLTHLFQIDDFFESTESIFLHIYIYLSLHSIINFFFLFLSRFCLYF